MIKDAIANIARKRQNSPHTSQTASLVFWDTSPVCRLGRSRLRGGRTAYGGPSIVGVGDIVWVTEKGDSCDPSTPDDAGGTSASELLEEYEPLLLAGRSEL